MEREVNKRTKWLVLLGLVIAAAVAAAALSGRGNAGASPTPSVSALDGAPIATSLPPSVSQWAARYAARGLAEPGTLRQLRANVGGRNTGIYGFRNTRGGVCFLYAEFAGACSNASHLRRTGIHWVIGAGVFVGLVTDNVKAVGLTVDEASVPVSLRNNVAFAEFDGGESARISVTYGNGASERSHVTLSGSFPSPPSG